MTRFVRRNVFGTVKEKDRRRNGMGRLVSTFGLLYPVVEVYKKKDVETHECIRVKDYNVCACLFRFKCPKCNKVIEAQSKSLVKYSMKYGCFKCMPNYRRKMRSVNNGVKVTNPRTRKIIGNIGEQKVGLHFSEELYSIYYGATGNEPDVDLVVVNNKTGKSATIQVKTSIFDHNNFLNKNSVSIIRGSKMGNIKFQFLICYLYSYELFYIIPKKEFIRKLNTRFTFNYLRVGDKKADIYPFENAWHLVEDYLK